MHLEQATETCTDAKNFEFLIKSFLLNHTACKNTLNTYSRYLRLFMAAMPDDLSDIRLETIEKFLLIYAKGHKPSSVNLFTKVIKSFYKWLGDQGYKDLGRYLPIQTALPPDQRILSQIEYKIACEAVTGYQSDCFKFLCATGVRVSEFISLDKNNISNGFLRVVGKGRRGRSIPLNRTALEIIARNPNFEFIRRRSRIWVFRLCKSISLLAKIPTFHPHSCRHYFANELYHRGIDMYTISRLLGHANTAVTETVYVHWSEESLRGATDILD